MFDKLLAALVSQDRFAVGRLLDGLTNVQIREVLIEYVNRHERVQWHTSPLRPPAGRHVRVAVQPGSGIWPGPFNEVGFISHEGVWHTLVTQDYSPNFSFQPIPVDAQVIAWRHLPRYQEVSMSNEWRDPTTNPPKFDEVV